MLNKIYKRENFKNRLAVLRGAKILKNENKPFYVVDSVSALTDINLNIDDKIFSSSLVGSHQSIIEVLLRQILLKNYSLYCNRIMRSIGNGKPVVIPIPKVWQNHFSRNGLVFNKNLCLAFLFFISVKDLFKGLIQSILYITPFNDFVSIKCPYVMFFDQEEKNLPIAGIKSKNNLVSWYRKSKINKPHIKKFLIHGKFNKNYVPPNELIVTQFIFPRLSSFYKCLVFSYKNIIAFLTAILGLINGNWWAGFLYKESILLNYLSTVEKDELAEDYYFSNSTWYYKPLWTNEIENKGISIIMYNYSINMAKFWRWDKVEPDTYGCNTMTWKNIVTWDAKQNEFFKKYCPEAKYYVLGSIDFKNCDVIKIEEKTKNRLVIFDVTPFRPLFYTSLGYAIPPYYSEKINLDFLSTLLYVFDDSKWEIIFKQKKKLISQWVSPGFIIRQKKLISSSVTEVDQNISAKAIIENANAVISMPFTSTSYQAAELNIPSAYFDVSGMIQINNFYGITTIKNQNELVQWKDWLDLKNNI